MRRMVDLEVGMATAVGVVGAEWWLAGLGERLAATTLMREVVGLGRQRYCDFAGQEEHSVEMGECQTD